MSTKKKLTIIFSTAALLAIVLCGMILFGEEKPKTIQWASKGNYAFSVGVAGFDGDTYPSGIYTFYQTDVAEGKPPIVWDIYTSYNLYTNSDELPQEAFKGSVGGMEGDSLFGSITSKYVYVVYHGTSESSGILNIKIEPLQK